MSVSTGLHRIAKVAQILAYLWVGILLCLWLIGGGGVDEDNASKFIFFGIIPSTILWTIGWITEGFAKAK